MKNKNLVQFAFILLAIVLMGMSVKAQNTSGGPGTSTYYSDDTVIRTVTSRVRIKRLGWIHVGGNPQVRGGLYNIPPAADEEDVELDREITIMTMSRSRVLYIGQLPTTLDNGVKVIVRRKKTTGKIIAIVNCGNWSREVGAEPGVIVDKQTEYLKCEPKPGGMQKISDTTNGNTRTEVYSDGCKTETTNTITNAGTNTTVCVEGSWIEVVRAGNDRGKVSGKKFLAEEMIPAEIRDAILSQEPALKGKKVKFLQVLQGACENERGKFKLIWFTGEGWHWKEFFLGFGAGFLTGFIVRGTPDCPVLVPPTNGIKNQNGTNGNTRPPIVSTTPTTTNTRKRVKP